MKEIKFIVIIMLACIMSICGFAQNSNEQDLLKEANLGNSEAQYKMGKCLGDKKEYTQAFEWYSKAAAQGFAPAAYIIGYYYENGMGVEKNTAKAFEWWSKAAAQGFAKAEYAIGRCYEKGMGVEKNRAKAFEWYSKAAAQGNANGQYMLAFYYENGGVFGVPGVFKNLKEAFEWYSKAATQGHIGAQRRLAYFYSRGIGVEKNNDKASEWTSKADALVAAKAKRNATKVSEWYSKAASGDANSQYNLAIAYRDGIGVEKNNIKSCIWMSRAANNGSLAAQIYWMKHYQERDGDASLKMKYILLASRQGSEEAKELFRQVAGMPYAQLDTTYRSKIKTYVGEYTLPTLRAPYDINLSNCHCRYQYYEVGDVRIYHGIFEVQSNESVRTKEGKTIPLFTIKGHFKDGYRDGIWVVELHHGGSGHWLKVPYRDGNIDGLWKENCGGEINAEYENNILSKFSWKYKDGRYTEAYLDDEGYMHGEYIFHGKKYIYKGNFIHGISEDYSELNIQTGDIERKIISATRTDEYMELCLFDSILGAFMHHTFQRGLAMISWDGKRASPTYKGKLKYRINKK
ncbi:tetratricopeptide repeat protein [Bacteroides zhangwenhongii]|uniref:tetratricopeptide repeat protein n=1 Tax=Bacteroides zhangwenhongii TaxID=2650157 RepID=UPI0022E31FBB|nr:tetratricopeptide repeat protein [Bacteroides zhangwenhongii]